MNMTALIDRAQIRYCVLTVIYVHFALLSLSNPISMKDAGIKS